MTWVICTQEYIAVFEPLVLEECGALLVRGNEEASNMHAHQAVVAITSLVQITLPLSPMLLPITSSFMIFALLRNSSGKCFTNSPNLFCSGIN